MWISRNEYENLKSNIKCLESRYTSEREKTLELLQKCNNLHWDIDELNERIKQLETYKQEAESYKHKYVDEVQKRLELIKLLENTP